MIRFIKRKRLSSLVFHIANLQGLLAFCTLIVFSFRPAPPPPSVVGAAVRTEVFNGNNLNVSISTTGLNLPNGSLNNATINQSSVKLFVDLTNTEVPNLIVNGTAGGDAITLTASRDNGVGGLAFGTRYRMEILSQAVQDNSGQYLDPFTFTFTTSEDRGNAPSGIKFEQTTIATGAQYTCVTIGPDGNLYGLVNNGLIYRWNILPDGTLDSPQIINSLQTAEGGDRFAIHLAFDPSSTSNNLIAWLSHSAPGVSGNPDWQGKITRLSGANLEVVQDYLINLPRSRGDHMTYGIDFGPDGALYFLQGSNTGMGDIDGTWGTRGERILTSAVIRVDIPSITNPPLDVKTAEGGTYDPFLPGAPVTLYATGLRNSFDLEWTQNGQLYVPCNGSAPGGSMPSTPGFPAVPSGIPQRIDGRGDADLLAAPALSNVSQNQTDLLYRCEQGGYYGHPNPTRGEYIAYGGNPTSGEDPIQVDAYPVGTLPDPNWRGYSYEFGESIAPTGIIEYQSNAFGGTLKNKLLVLRYGAGDDIVVLTPGANLDIVRADEGIAGFTGFNNPVDITENTQTGDLYVTEYGSSEITLLRPIEGSSIPDSLIGTPIASFPWDQGDDGYGFWRKDINCGSANQPGGENNTQGSRVTFGVTNEQRFPGTYSVELWTNSNFEERCSQNFTAERAEISANQSYRDLNIAEDTTVWMGWSEKWTDIDESHHTTVLQFRSNCSTGSPATQLILEPGRLLQVVNLATRGEHPIGTVNEDTWYDFIVEIKYSKNNNGYIKVWMHEVGSDSRFCYENPSVAVMNISTMRSNDGCPHIRWGVYRWESGDKKPEEIAVQDRMMVKYHGPVRFYKGTNLGEVGFETVKPVPNNYVRPSIVNVQSTPLSNCGLTDGTITIETLGSDLEYSIDGGYTFQSDSIFTNLDSGAYQVVIREQRQTTCSEVYADTPTLILSPQIPSISQVISHDASDCNINDGEIHIAAGGNNLAYSIDGGQSYQADSFFTGLSVGVYQIVVRDSVYTNCSENYSSNPILIQDPSYSLSYSDVVVNNIEDCGFSNGSIEINAGGSNLEYSIDGGVSFQDSSRFINLNAGNYNIVIRDSLFKNCPVAYALNPIVLTTPVIPLITGVTYSDITDCGLTDGAISIQSQGVNLEYSIDGGISYGSDSVFSGLDSGTYAVWIREVGRPNCITSFASNPIRILAPSIPQILGVSTSDLTDCGLTNGTISIQSQGVNLEYSIDGGLNFSSDSIFTGLDSGIYQVVIREIGTVNCQEVYTNNPVNILSPGRPIISDLLLTDVSDCGLTDGEIHIIAAGNNLSYSIDGGINYQVDSFFTNLAIGDYEIILRDSVLNGCTANYESNPVSIQDPSSLLSFVSVTNADISDCGLVDGSIEIDAGGSNLEYSIDGGVTYQDSARFLGLNAGSYTLVLRDSTLRSCILSYESNPVIVSAPSIPLITGVSYSDITDCGLTDGEISIQSQGVNLEYSIDGGINYTTDSVFRGLDSGSYEIWIREIGKPSCIASYPSNPIEIVAPIAPQITGISTTDLTDCGVTNGTISIQTIGRNLAYSIDGGILFFPDSVFTGLDSGSYQVLIREIGQVGCQATYANNPVEILSPGSPTISSILLTDVSNCGLSDGEIHITATGNNLAYSIDGGTSYQADSFFTNLAIGVYDVRVRDSILNGCSTPVDSNSVRIQDPSALISFGQVTTTDISDCGLVDGSIVIQAVGTNLEYSIDGGVTYQDSSRFLGLTAGTYALVLRDSVLQNCTLSYGANPVTILTPSIPQITGVTHSDLTNCGITDGEISIQSQGVNLEYSIDGGISYSPDSVFSGLDSGNYEIWIREVGKINCIANYGLNPLRILAPTEPEITGITPSDISDCGLMDGAISVQTIGRNLEYSIDGGLTYAPDSVFSALDSGRYFVQIREIGQVGCQDSYQGNPVEIRLPAYISISQVTVQEGSACGSLDGSIQIQAVGDSLEYSIDGGQTYQDSGLFTNLATGSYEVIVREVTYPNCLRLYESNPVLVIAPAAPAITGLSTSSVTSCGFTDGSLTVQATGDNLEYSLDGTNFQSSNVFNGLGEGTYLVQVRTVGFSGCETSSLQTVSGPANCNAAECTEATNLALNQPSTQSTTYGQGIAGFANDGNRAGNDNWGSDANMSHTNSGAGSWWKVDLGEEATLERIDIFNRSTTNSGLLSRLSNFYVFISLTDIDGSRGNTALDNDPNVTSIFFSGDASATETFSLNEVQGRYVMIALTGNGPLHMAEVEVYGCAGPPPVCDLTLTQVLTQDVSSCQTNDGSITVLATGTSIEYSLDGNTYQSSNQFTGLAAGTYNVSIRKSNLSGCGATFPANPVEINAPTAPVISMVQPTDPSVCGGSDGSISILAAGASLEYSIDGIGYQSDSIFNGLRAGSYTVFVRNASGCIGAYGTNPVVLSDPGGPEITAVQVVDPSDCGGTDGSISLTASEANLEYSMDGVSYQSLSNFSNLGAGSYNLSVRTSEGCIEMYAANPVVLIEPIAPVMTTLLPSAPSICGGADGSISVTAIGSNLAYSLDGTNYQATSQFTGLTAGNYIVYVRSTSAPNCIANMGTEVPASGACGPPECTNPTNLALNQPSSQSTTYGQGIPSFTNDGNRTGNDNWGSDANMSHTQIGAGAWWKVDLGEEAYLERIDIYNRTTTSTGILGRLKDFYVFISLDDIDGSRGFTALSTDSNITTQYFSGEAGATETFALDQVQGRYVMIALTGNGPLHMAEVEVYGCTGPPPVCDLSFTQVLTQNVSSCQTNDGSITVFATGTNIEFSLDGSTYQSSNQFTGLAAGSYNLSIRKSNLSSCVVPYAGNPIVISAPNEPIISSVQMIDPSVCGSLDGSISITASGSALQYSIDGVSYQSDSVFNNLGAGSYTVFVRNAANCIGTYSTNPIVLSEPSGPEITAVQVVNPSDCGGTDGNISLTVSGSNLEYSIDGIVYQNTPNFSDLNAGSYNVSIRTLEGCIEAYDANPVVLVDPALPTISSLLPTSPTECGGNDGRVVVTATGSNLEYSMDGVNYQAGAEFIGLSAGGYILHVRNSIALSCVVNAPVEIAASTACGPPECTNPTNLALNQPASQSTTYGQGLASFANDGSRIGNDNWGSDANMSHTNSGAGAWWKVDLGEETTLDRVEIYNRSTTNSGLLGRLKDFYVFTSLSDIDGSRGVTALSNDVNIQAIYFSGEAGAVEALTLNQIQGRYVMIALTGNGPLHMAEVEVYGCAGPPPVCDLSLVQVLPQDESSCQTNDGSITVLATGTNIEYSLDGSTYQSSNQFTELGGGSYNVSIRKSNLPSCVMTYPSNPIMINAPSVPVISNIQVNETSDCGQSDGSITLSATGQNLEYSLDGSVFQASNTFTGLAAGNYTAWVRNASLNSCSASSSVSIADPEACGPSECTNPTNLALNKPSSQSSTRGQGVASFVNDGNTTGNDNWGSDADMHHTENGDNQLWWKVDLGEVATLSRVDIFNRTTTNSGLLSRLTDFYIFISASDIDGTRSLSDLAADPIIANEFFTGAAGAFESINLDQAQGRYIMIRLSGSGPLHMAEVEVYGCSNSGNASPANPLREAFQPVEGDQLEEFLWKISPNPFKESFTVEVYSELKENTFVELYNALGQRVGYYRMPESKRLSLSPRFAEGIYFMYLIVGEQTYQGKIIKAR